MDENRRLPRLPNLWKTPDDAIKAMARTCHQANKAYCESIGDFSQYDWERAPEWAKESAIKGVTFRLLNPDAPASAQHESWMQEKLLEGWVYGEEKDPEKKTHPCIVAYDELPEHQRKKDELFMSIVQALSLVDSDAEREIVVP